MLHMIQILLPIVGMENSPKISKAHNKVQILITALNQKELSAEVLTFVDEQIGAMNAYSGSDIDLIKMLKKTYSQIMKFVKMKLKFVPRHYYLSTSFIFGMLALLSVSSLMGQFNILYVGSTQVMGVAMGMLIGILVGNKLDKHAEKTGKQLDL